MENTLQHCLPLIRFFSLSSKEFLENVHPFKNLINHQLYKNLLNSHLDPESEPTDDISFPRIIKNDGIIDSKIVNNLNIISTISRRIDKMVINNKFDHLRGLYLPYNFQLLLIGSRDGFTPRKFHQLCDGKHNTVTFIKVKGTEEILGGYNPIKWDSSGWGKTKDSFIFSYKNNFIKDIIISNVVDSEYALQCQTRLGPYFGSDIIIYNNSIESADYNNIRCRKYYYEKKIRDTEEKFSIEDYEVYQITRR
ncbi:hypothetical protein C1646_724611 [Rhizophagus diaphanus]|nr:hypothetical protein C1646_731436 [Rhizophagus diaphanus] [Rhizophagus sp. MUCL 43196]RGB25085.1 hypothetical protein C1646_724611 [Rhizophagus diaphanus] [Rhizophagus sp. MUCL 43196]